MEPVEVLRLGSDLHQLLTENQCQVYVGTTGAGPHLLKSIWDVPGCSAYFVGSNMPYKKYQTDLFIGYKCEGSYVSAGLSLELAMSSYMASEENRIIENRSGMSIGVGIEAAVSTGRILNSGPRVHISIITPTGVYYDHLALDGTRTGQEARVDDDIQIANRVCALLRFILIGELFNDPLAEAQAIELFFEHPIFTPSGIRHRFDQNSRRVYLAANLNPIHEGHRQMCRSAEASLDIAKTVGVGSTRTNYLVEMDPPNKKALTLQSMLHTVAMIRADRWVGESRPIEFTRGEHLYIEKARRRPGSIFLMGADAMQRMLDPAWGPDIHAMLAEFKQLNTIFYVMGRLVDGQWLQCRDIKVPWPDSELFRPLEGRVDESSSRIRESLNGNS